MPRERRRRQTSNHKLGIIVPYRDRPQQLKRFIKHMEEYLSDYDYEIYIVEQTDNKPFNRGKLLNIGYVLGVQSNCDYFAFHDVDMLPEDVDYSYPNKPLHLATHLQEHDYQTTFYDYFGGVVLFSKEDFETINGYSNDYWGWGFEDDDLLIRCLESDLELDIHNEGFETYESPISTFKFSGDSYIHLKGQKTNLLEDDFTISVAVKPTQVKLNENKNYDEFPIISIPGYNIGIFYNSFRRFFCQVYDLDKKPYSISTGIVGESWIHLTMRIENKKDISFYKNGELIGEVHMENDILDLSTDNIYIGAPNGEDHNTQFFYGHISSIEFYDIGLTDEEIQYLSKNPTKSKLRNSDTFVSSEFLKTQLLPEISNTYEALDIGRTYNCKLHNIYLDRLPQTYRTFLPKPYRRDGRFKSLKHKSNSSIGNRWVHQETRINQLKYYNEVRQYISNYQIDGLNTLRYEILDEEQLSDNITKIKVEI